MKKDEQNIRQFWDTIKYGNVCIMEILVGKREKKMRKIFEEIMGGSSLNFIKCMNLHIQEIQQTTRRTQAKRSTVSLIIKELQAEDK